MKSVFKLRNLECAYRHNVHVLRIESLDIPRGKIIFIVGRSGIGKSTLLELLGLMNDPFVRRDESQVEFTDLEGHTTNILRLWEVADDICSSFRKRHYSFMFQQTNLMPNFTCGENMMISMLINGVKEQDARDQVLTVMDQLSLPKNLFNKSVNEVSGGQRQRLAFVRAVTSQFSVLFGDEPTGNLDKVSAYEIMAVLTSLVHENQRSCIIVSHDIELADKFADVVIPIGGQPLPDGGISGIVRQEDMLFKTSSQWTKEDGSLALHPDSILQDCLQKNNILVRA